MITKEIKLKEIEARIRKDLPYLMELSKGCKFLKPEEFGFKYEYEILNVFGGTPIADTGDFDDVKCDIISDYNGIELGWYIEDIENYEIIGHPIRINNVLRWLKLYESKVNSENEYPEDPYILEFRYNIHHDLEIFNDGGLLSSINLEKSLLEDQSEDFINFLYELL